MDEYELEIHSLKVKLADLHAKEADPLLIEEYETEVRNLSALYAAATATLDVGERDPGLRIVLSQLGYGDWTLDNVYAFVYDATMEIDAQEKELATLVRETDYVGSLREVDIPSGL